MSSVRMCDKCQTVFSELDAGWQTYDATTNDIDDAGKAITLHVRMDACPDCAITTPKRLSKREREIAQLEKATGVGSGDPFRPITPITPEAS